MNAGAAAIEGAVFWQDGGAAADSIALLYIISNYRLYKENNEIEVLRFFERKSSGFCSPLFFYFNFCLNSFSRL